MFWVIFRELCTERGVKPTPLLRSLGIATGLSTKWKNGAIPDTKSLDILSNYFGVSIDYLLGKSEIKKTPAIPKNGKGKWIPVLGRVAAGIPVEAVEDIIDYEEISAKMAASGDYFALQIHGQSMEPKMSEGDVVIIRKQEYADTGDTVIVLVNGSDATCKKIKFSENGIVLIPTNPAFEPMFFSKHDIETLPVQVIGKVVELRAKY